MKWVSKRKLGLLMVMLCLCLVMACGKESEGSDNKGLCAKKGSLPEDTPWNHGYDAIMETDYAWYTLGLGEDLCLRYYDKETKNTILLCSKPECEHLGDDQCEATFQGMKVVNACLYEGYIYLLGWQGLVDPKAEEPIDKSGAGTINLSLYRAALDGSAIDRVGTVFETDNEQAQAVEYLDGRTSGVLSFEHNDESFIIHKGVAYISYYLRLGKGSIGLRGGGFLKMDLATGQTKDVETVETLQDHPPVFLSGAGDYVYYGHYDGRTETTSWLRYVISEEKIESMDPKIEKQTEETPIFGKTVEVLDAQPCFTANRSYWLVRTYQEKEDGQIAVIAVDVSTQKIVPEESFETGITFDKKKYRYDPRRYGYYSLMLYDGKFFIADMGDVRVYDAKGSLVGEVAVPKETLKMNDVEKDVTLDFKISNEKLYLTYGNDYNMSYAYDDFASTRYYFLTYACPLPDLYAGKGTWTKCYRKQGKETWAEYTATQLENELKHVPVEYRDEIREQKQEMLDQMLSEE
ncbi:MAG: hypothetical protein II139_04680 [Lachnospiraceae bacterium]|nr:hypothetical protein [Lachnospiraceae bacterium]